MSRQIAPTPTFSLALMALAIVATTGCQTASQGHLEAVHHYYDYDFTASRQMLRRRAETVLDRDSILDNLRLGVTALADGDSREAERVLHRVFDWMSTAGLNADNTTAAVWQHEGVRIWKGEPFEQAMAYYYVAALYGTMQDWENMRAAAANSIFRLTDFGGDHTPASLVHAETEEPGYLDQYIAVDTSFSLGLLMQAIGADHADEVGVEDLLNTAVQINPSLEPIAQRIADQNYDTLFIIDYGQGPVKHAYGPDNALVAFDPVQDLTGPLRIDADGRPVAEFGPVCDVNRMASDYRWNNLDDVRRAKSAIGSLLVAGGAVAIAEGGRHDSDEAQLAGLAAVLGGLYLKATARGDTRHLEMLPQSVFLAPVRLTVQRDVTISVGGDGDSTLILPDFTPGRTDEPRVVYLRLNGPGMAPPSWMTARRVSFGNDHTGVMPGDYPWILGGTDVSTPSRTTLEAYQQGGYLRDLTVLDLQDLYRAEGILIGSGMETRSDVPRNPSYRHILEGGRGLFTPQPDSMGYKRLMFTPQPPYRPISPLVRNLAARISAYNAAQNEALALERQP